MHSANFGETPFAKFTTPLPRSFQAFPNKGTPRVDTVPPICTRHMYKKTPFRAPHTDRYRFFGRTSLCTHNTVFAGLCVGHFVPFTAGPNGPERRRGNRRAARYYRILMYDAPVASYSVHKKYCRIGVG